MTDWPKIVPEVFGRTDTVLLDRFAMKRSPAESNAMAFGLSSPEETTVAKVLAITERPKIVPDVFGNTDTE